MVSKIYDQDWIGTEFMEKNWGIFMLKSCILLIFWTLFGLGLYI